MGANTSIKKELFSIIDTLREASGLIKGLIKENNRSALTNLLADCQECAIAMGSQIEEAYEENAKTVGAIGQYCEALYYLAQAQGEEAQQLKHQAVEGQLEQIESWIKWELDIPEEWKKILYKADGERKQVVLYHTNVANLLAHGGKTVEKIKIALKEFKSYREEIALIWRPHPRVTEILEPDFPKLLEDYARAVEQYREEGWGIYDDSGDFDRAADLSRMYYGDYCSQMYGYRRPDRPVVIQEHWRDREAAASMLLQSHYACIEDDRLFLVSAITNAVIALSAKTGKILQVIPIRGEKSKYSLSAVFAKVKDKLYLAPWTADQLRVIDLNTGEQRIIEAAVQEGEETVAGKYMTMVPHQGKLWLVGENINRIVCIDTDNGDQAQSYPMETTTTREDKKLVWSKNYLIRGELIIVPSRNWGYILYLDTGRLDFRVERLNDAPGGYTDIYEYDHQIYLMGADGRETKLLPEKNKAVPVSGKRSRCDKIVVYKDKKYTFSANQGEIIEVTDMATGERAEIKNNSLTLPEAVAESCHFIQRDQKYCYYQQALSREIYRLDMDTDRIEKLPVEAEGDFDLEKIRKEKLEYMLSRNDEYLVENDCLYLSGYLRHFVLG